MTVAAVVLSYLKVLVWPLLVVFVIVFFRRQFVVLFSRLIATKLPGGIELVLAPIERVLADPDTTDEGRSVALQIAQEVVESARLPAEELFVRQVAQALSVVMGRGSLVTQGGDRAIELADIQVGWASLHGAPTLIPVEVKSSVRLKDRAFEAMQRRGVERGLIVVYRGQVPTFEELRPGFVLVAWANVSDNENLRKGLLQLGILPGPDYSELDKKRSAD